MPQPPDRPGRLSERPPLRSVAGPPPPPGGRDGWVRGGNGAPPERGPSVVLISLRWVPCSVPSRSRHSGHLGRTRDSGVPTCLLLGNAHCDPRPQREHRYGTRLGPFLF